MANYTWTGSAKDGNYANPANWSPSGIPGPADTVTISTGAATTINAGGGGADALKTNANVTLEVGNNSAFTFGSGTGTASFTNGGTVLLASGNAAILVGDSKLTLGGAGTIMMAGGSATIEGAAATDVLANVGNTIEGGGQLGAGTLTFVNFAGGVVDANTADQLVLNTGTVAVSNSGTIEATQGGGLVIESSIQNGAAGVVSAAGADVFINNGVTITGGTLASSAGASLQASGSVTLSGLANTGLLALADSGTLSLAGGIANTGTITENTISNHASTLVIGPATGTVTGAAGTVLLSGSGTLLLDANGGNLIVAGQAGDTLNNASNTIEGSGQIGAGGGLHFINGGVVSAGAELIINTGTVAMSNAGLLEATGGNELVLQSAVTSTAAGDIEAAGGTVLLQGASFAGGTIGSSGNGFVQASGAATLSGITNTGSLAVADSATVTLLGTITNTGTITENTVSNHASTLAIGSATGAGTTTLSGGGALILDANGGNMILAGRAGDTLNNTNNTISGTGTFGLGNLALINGGSIGGAGALAIDVSTLSNSGTILAAGGGSTSVTGTITNTGLINLQGASVMTLAGRLTNAAGGTISANGGTFNITGVTATNAGLIDLSGTSETSISGTINSGATGTFIASSAQLNLDGGVLAGGTIANSLGGSIVIGGTQTLDGRAQAVTNLGTVELTNQTLTLQGTIANLGTMSLNSYAGDPAASVLEIGSAAVLLTGSGTLTLDDAGADQILGAATGDSLDNVNNTILGSGLIGGAMSMINGTLGIIDAVTTPATGGPGLTIDMAGVLTNDGLLEATSATLYLDNTIDNRSGTIDGAGAVVALSGGTIEGGTLASSAGGSIVIAGTQTFDGLPEAVTNLGAVEVTDRTLTLQGTFANLGTLSLNGYAGDPGAAMLEIASPTVTLTGGGTLTLDNAGADQILGAATGDSLDNINNTILGSGLIAGTMSVINGALGIIDAVTTPATGAPGLTIDTSGVLTNDGLIEATSATLYIDSTIDNRAGVIDAAGALVALNGGTIEGGTVGSTGTGSLILTSSSTLDGSSEAVANTGIIQVAGNTLSLLGTLNNYGAIDLYNTPGYAYQSGLAIASPELVLSGGGTIVLEDRGNNFITALSGVSATLDNVDNHIEGSGTIGGMDIINGAAGVIDAAGTNGNGSDGLIINVIDHTLTNNGLIETSGVTLTLEGTIIQGLGGEILAAAGTIDLEAAIIEGGIIETTGTGTIMFASGDNTFDGSHTPVTLMSTVEVNAGTTLTLLGSIVNDNQIDLFGGAAELLITSPTLTLSGGGTISLNDDSSNVITGATAATELYNESNTIEGSGQIGAGALTLINGGTISATGAHALVLDLSGAGTNTASGLLLGAGSGGLSIAAGTITNSGLIAAENGSNVTFGAGGTLTNDSAGTLTGGTYAALAAGNGATIGITGAAITTDAATLVLSGAGSVIDFGGTAIDASLTTIAKGGVLELLGARNFTSTQAISNSGTLELAGGTFTAKSFTSFGGSVISGFGTFAVALHTNGSVVAQGGTLDLHGNNGFGGGISGTGTLQFDGGHSTLATTQAVTVSTIAVINGASLALNNNLHFAGTFDIVGATTISGAGTFTNTGNFDRTGTRKAIIATAFSNAGTIGIGAGGALAFTGGLANTGLINDSGSFTDTAALTGGSLHINAASAAIIASGAGAGASTLATLTLGGGNFNTSGTTLTVTGDYVNAATGSGNAYNAEAHVTGTIDGAGTQLAVIGVDGTTIETVNGTLTIAVAAGQTAHFEVENAGSAGAAALRGALQTTVDGGSITGTALTGSGVTAGNFGPIAAGAHGNIYAITYNGGTLGDEAIHIASDFANVAGVTVDIVAQADAPSELAAAAPAPELAVSHLISLHSWQF